MHPFGSSARQPRSQSCALGPVMVKTCRQSVVYGRCRATGKPGDMFEMPVPSILTISCALQLEPRCASMGYKVEGHLCARRPTNQHVARARVSARNMALARELAPRRCNSSSPHSCASIVCGVVDAGAIETRQVLDWRRR